MKQLEETKIGGAKTKQVVPPPPPPLPPLPRFWVKKSFTESVTNQEIAKFWRQKRIEEEDHLLAAIKAAARIKARNLSEEDYKCFEDSLKDEDEDTMENNTAVDKKQVCLLKPASHKVHGSFQKNFHLYSQLFAL
ncbi:hypothetical protein CFP56_016279 [Quercus suber]|uniref:Uncharacterized protein n=1 Tax=Quercus suber TaxID=58331 RepID=A0AAW0KMK4_QUESU